MNSWMDADRWNEIWHVLMRNKTRTFLTAFGVFWGIFMLVIMLGSGNGLENGVKKGFAGHATNSVFMWAEETTIPYKGLPRGRHYNFKNEDVKAALAAIPEIKALAPRCQLGGWRGGNNVVRGTVTAAFTITGDLPVIQEIQSVTLTSGRFINNFDIHEKRKVCVIGSRVREVLFKKNEDPLNEYIRIQGVYFKVIGTFKTTSSNDREESMNTIYLPFSTFQQVFNWGDNLGWFAITSKDDVPISKVLEKLVPLLQERHKIAPADKAAIGYFNLEEEFQKFQGLFTGIRTLIWIVGTGTLLAGVIGVSNIMLIVVRERTKEIGIRRALGAPPSNIITQIMAEAVILTLTAGYFGLVTGVLLLETISKSIGEGGEEAMFLHPEIDIKVAIYALLILIVSGLLAGLIPARRAIAVPTVEALRTE